MFLLSPSLWYSLALPGLVVWGERIEHFFCSIALRLAAEFCVTSVSNTAELASLYFFSLEGT